MSRLHSAPKSQRVENVLRTVVMPAFVEAYKQAEESGFDVRNAFKSNYEDISKRLAGEALKAA